MNATSSQIKLRKSFPCAKFFQKCKVMHFYLGEDFILAKMGVTNLPPLEGLPLKIQEALGNNSE
jgi:hypothetical protein